jgi:hypothetical protein
LSSFARGEESLRVARQRRIERKWLSRKRYGWDRNCVERLRQNGAAGTVYQQEFSATSLDFCRAPVLQFRCQPPPANED